jgi:type IV pilus assembly protein PilC
MAKFKYVARDKAGNLKEGDIEAQNHDSAGEVLKNYGLFIIELTEIKEGGLSRYVREISGKEKPKDIMIFTRQLSTLIASNIPPVQALTTLSKQVKSPTFSEKIKKIAADIEGGSTFSESLKKYPKVFSPLFISMVNSGEVSGNLDKSLDYLAGHLEKNYELNKKVKSAMTYPLFVIGAIVIVGVLAITLIIPRLKPILESFGGNLPFTTRLLLNGSDFITSYWWLFLLAVMVIALIGWNYFKSKEGRAALDNFVLKVPVFGPLLKNIYLARFTENLSTLITGGIPIIKSLNIVSSIINNAAFRDSLAEAALKVKGGVPLSESLTEYQKVFPPIVVHMISVGEKTGKLDSVLNDIARFYNREADATISNLSALIEPLMIVLLGGAIGVLMVSILMPIYNITNSF